MGELDYEMCKDHQQVISLSYLVKYVAVEDMDFVKPLKTKKAESQKTTLPINNPIIFKEDNVLFLKVLIRI